MPEADVHPASAPPGIELAGPTLGVLPMRQLRAMVMAGAEVLECQRVLARGGINLVSEVLRDQGPFIEYEHYPRNDVFDLESGSQYYYHAHRGAAGEHGHFHTFLRRPLASDNSAHPLKRPGDAGKPAPDDAVTHLIGISMDAYGWPIGLFATNHWVCGGEWLPAHGTIKLLPGFRVDHAYPSWPVNRWIGAMLVLFRPHIEALLSHRDRVIENWARLHPGKDAFEDRDLEITGQLSVSVEHMVEQLRSLAGERSRPV